MKRAGIALLALGAGLLLAAPAASAAPSRACPSAGVRTLEAGVGGRVFYRPTRDPDRVFLCSYRGGRRTLLGWDDCFNAAGVELVAFSRRFLAVGIETCTAGGTLGGIDVRRVRDGRRVRRVVAAPGVVRRSDGAVLTVELVTDLVIRGGAVAWIVEIVNPAGTPEGTRTFQVRASARGRSSALLAEGDAIDSGSLALAGRRLYWSEAGAPRSAELP